MNQIIMIALMLVNPLSSGATETHTDRCGKKVEAVIRSILNAEGFENVTVCSDAEPDLCLWIEADDNRQKYWAQFAYGSSSYPAYFKFQVEVDSYCQLEKIVVAQE